MKTTWMCSLCQMEDPDDEHWHCNAKLGREFFSSMLITPIRDKKTTVNDGDICYRILPYLTRCNFFNISLHGWTAECHRHPIFTLFITGLCITKGKNVLCKNMRWLPSIIHKFLTVWIQLIIILTQLIQLMKSQLILSNPIGYHWCK